MTAAHAALLRKFTDLAFIRERHVGEAIPPLYLVQTIKASGHYYLWRSPRLG
jgi:hypothetical protein